MCVLELMNEHVLQTLREQLKVPGSRLEGSELLTSEFLRFRSCLNETSGGLGKIGAVSGLSLNYCQPQIRAVWQRPSTRTDPHTCCKSSVNDFCFVETNYSKQLFHT